MAGDRQSVVATEPNMLAGSHGAASLADSHIGNSEAMHSDLVQELLAKVGDAHSRALSSMRANYEAQICGLRHEVNLLQPHHLSKGTLEATDATNVRANPSFHSSNSATSSNGIAENPSAADCSIAVEGKIDLPLAPVMIGKVTPIAIEVGSLDFDIDGQSYTISDKKLVGCQAARQVSELTDGSDSQSPRRSWSINRKLQLRKQWTVHPEQDEKDLLAIAEMSNSNLAELRDGQGIEFVLEGGPRSCQDLVSTPGATWRLWWDLSGALLIGYDTIMIPFSLSFDPEDNHFFTLMNWVAMIFWSLDMTFTFFVGYSNKSGQTVMNLPLIARRYMQSWFVLDLVVLLGDWFNNIGEAMNSGKEGNLSSTAKLVRSLRTIRILRLLRLLKLKKMIAGLQDHISSEDTYLALNMVKLLFFILLLNHLIACGWYALAAAKLQNNDANWISFNKLEHKDVGYKYTTSLHWSLTQFTPAAMEVFPQSTEERTMSVFVLIFALGVFSSFLGSISASMTALRNMNADENKQFWMLRRYLKQQKVSKLVGRRILKYLEYLLEKRQGNVQQASITILSLLSAQLREELTYELTSPQIHKQLFFQYFLAFPLMDVVMWKICSAALKTNIIASGDHLFYPGDEATFVYCFLSGEMDYFLEDSQPIDPPVMEQEWIGEAAFWVPWKYVGKFAAQAESELISIDIGKFVAHLCQNVLSWKYASQYGEVFLDHFNGSASHSDIFRDEVVVESLIEDLTHKHMTHGLHLKWKHHSRRATRRPSV